MSDLKSRLAATLAELHEELAATSAADTEVRQLLSRALADIQAKLQASPGEASKALTEDGSDGLGDRLRGAAVHFEQSHPTLSGLINSLVDTLTQLGI